MELVDLKEAQELLGKSRATIFRMLQSGVLVPIHVMGHHESYVTLESVERCQGPQFQLKLLDSANSRKAKQREIKKYFSEAFSRYSRSPRGRHRGRSPSSEE